MAASESCALPSKSVLKCEVKPGEIIEITQSGIRSVCQVSSPLFYIRYLVIENIISYFVYFPRFLIMFIYQNAFRKYFRDFFKSVLLAIFRAIYILFN